MLVLVPGIWAGSGFGQKGSGPGAADPSFTARFLPIRIYPEDSAQARLFRNLVSRFRVDSTHYCRPVGDGFEISQDLFAEMTGGDFSDSSGEGLGKKFSRFLSRKHGLRFQAGGAGYAQYTPDDSLFAATPQWALNNTGAAVASIPGKVGSDVDIMKVWDKFSGADSLVIAVVDAGFNFQHPDLKGRNWVNAAEAKGLPGVDDDNNGFVDDSVGWDFVQNDNSPQDFNGHGTELSGVIAANFDNGMGVAGMLAQGKIMPVRVLDASGHGDVAAIAKGLQYAVNNGAKVINYSIGSGGSDNAVIRAAFQAALNKGIPIVVAAGNDAVNLDSVTAYPIDYGFNNMVIVGSHGNTDALSVWSNYGAGRVHMAAPGEYVETCGIPELKTLWSDDFEAATLTGWTASGFSLSTADPLLGTTSVVSTTGNGSTLTTTQYFDLTGVAGATLRFMIDFIPSLPGQQGIIVEGNTQGSATWVQIAGFTTRVTRQYTLIYALQAFDGTRFRLRFRTAIANGVPALAAYSVKIDRLGIFTPDLNPPTQAVYTNTGGTSISAPHVAAYVGLLRLACDRMGVPWTLARTMVGTTAVPGLSGKVSSGGRLDVYKGLQFYLNTLPELRFRDSTALAWQPNQKIQYTMDLNPASTQTYRYFASGLGAGAAADSVTGSLTWTPTAAQVGAYPVKLAARGTTTLRKRFTLTVTAAATALAPAASGGPARWAWRLGGQRFLIPEGLERSGRHKVEVIGFDPRGRTRILKSAWIDAQDFHRPLTVAGPVEWMLRFQIRVDGSLLKREE